MRAIRAAGDENAAIVQQRNEVAGLRERENAAGDATSVFGGIVDFECVGDLAGGIAAGYEHPSIFQKNCGGLGANGKHCVGAVQLSALDRKPRRNWWDRRGR